MQKHGPQSSSLGKHRIKWPGHPKCSLEAIMLRRFSSLTLAALFISYATYIAAQTNISKRPSILSLGVAGVATPQTNVLSVAAPLANLTNSAVAEVKIDRIQLAKAPVQTPLPMMVGAIRARSNVIVQAELNSESLRSGQRYEFVMLGTYRMLGTHRGSQGAARKFRVHTFVVMPPPSEGSGELRKTQVPSQKVEGGRYPPRPPRMDKDVNSGAPPVPTNPDSAWQAHTHDNRGQTRAEMRMQNLLIVLRPP